MALNMAWKEVKLMSQEIAAMSMKIYELEADLKRLKDNNGLK